MRIHMTRWKECENSRATVTKRFEGQAQTVGMHINLHVAILPNSDISVKSEMH